MTHIAMNAPTMITRSIAFLLLAASPLLADTIHRNDGTSVDDVTITTESLTEVAYKDGSKKKVIASSEILSIEYTVMPGLVDEASRFVRDGDPSSALSAFEDYVIENVPKVSERHSKWAPAYAAYMTIGLYQQLGNLSGMLDAADRMIKNFAKSRYLPDAYLLKAQAQVMAGQGKQATKTLDGLAALVRSEGLSMRWDLECRLARVRADDSRQGETRRAALSSIIQAAGSKYPTVKSRARVAEGESYLIEAEKTNDASKSKRLRKNGKGIFESIIEDKLSDDEALAGAHTGLGDCLFFEGAGSDNRSILKDAAVNYLRVITLYQSQSEYVAKSLFFAMRSFELMGNKSRVRDMKRDLLSLYPDSSWAKRQEVARAR